jgi:3-oxoacyl-[acyl-carrier protein] reductase
MKKKTALVTGASRGIGKSIKESLLNEQIEVFSPSRNELDLSSSESIDNFLTNLSTPVDILVNNAGILKVGRYNELSSDDFQEILQINVVAPFKLISGIVESMKRKKFGRIINISSIWGQKSREGRSIYSSSKAALDALTKSLALEFASYNVLINSVAPGYVDTELITKYNTDLELEKIKKTIPIQRFAKKIEISELVKFLCSEENSYITGQIVTIDGGYICK